MAGLAGFRRKHLGVMAVPVSLALLLAGCGDKQAQSAASTRPVLVATVHYEPEAAERSFVGTVRPRIETDIGFRVAGKVVKRFVQMGQKVKVGDPLAVLDENDFRLQKEQAEAEGLDKIFKIGRAHV